MLALLCSNQALNIVKECCGPILKFSNHSERFSDTSKTSSGRKNIRHQHNVIWFNPPLNHNVKKSVEKNLINLAKNYIPGNLINNDKIVVRVGILNN